MGEARRLSGGRSHDADDIAGGGRSSVVFAEGPVCADMYTLIIMNFRKMRLGSGGVDTDGKPMFCLRAGERTPNVVTYGLVGPGVHEVRSHGLGNTTREDPPVGLALLSDRERQVLLLLADGPTNRWLASQLGVTERTVRAHLTNICRKLNVESRVQPALVGDRNRRALLPDVAGADRVAARGNGRCPTVRE
jgi:DNA-binding CsgD family transcriptional regulator